MLTQIGKYQIKRILGNGAMGEVYLGVDPSIGRDVAIKTILPSSAESAEMKERFAREAKAAGTLNHPNLVTIYEFGEDQGVLFIAMEFVPGNDLEQLIIDQTLTRTEILEVLAQVCDGLFYAHQRQIIHRDIKPANVRVEREGNRLHTRVMDFGIARVGNSDMTSTGMVMGTVSYMAPEYIRTGRPDARSDLFAVAVMLYEALSGRRPFAGDTAPTILYKIVNQEPEPLDLSHFEGISPSIRHILDRGLDKDPDQRFQTAEEFAKALRAAKDPTWKGQALAPTLAPVMPPALTSTEPTTHLRSAAIAPVPAPGLPPPMPSIPVAPQKTTLKASWLIAATLVILAVGGIFAWKIFSRPPEDLIPASTTIQPSADTTPAPASTGLPANSQETPASPLNPESPESPLKPEAPLPLVKSGDGVEIRTKES
ncbi:MAG: protein kinase, partial [Holophaga sp.]|nr:protein kinase [Holophaga sp.]